jgi:hypothetical protein
MQIILKPKTEIVSSQEQTFPHPHTGLRNCGASCPTLRTWSWKNYGHGSREKTGHRWWHFLLPRVSWQVRRPLRAFLNYTPVMVKYFSFKYRNIHPTKWCDHHQTNPKKRQDSIPLTNIHTFSLFIDIFHLFAINVFVTIYKWEVGLGSHMRSSTVSENKTQKWPLLSSWCAATHCHYRYSHCEIRVIPQSDTLQEGSNCTRLPRNYIFNPEGSWTWPLSLLWTSVFTCRHLREECVPCPSPSRIFWRSNKIGHVNKPCQLDKY